MNLKLALMNLGNTLVQSHGFWPATQGIGAPGGKDTNPIDQFMRWLNDQPKAVSVLNEMGIVWPVVPKNHDPSQPWPTFSAPPHPVGYWVMEGTSDLCKWGKDGDTEYPFDDKYEAARQAKYIHDDYGGQQRVYILTVFSNGQMLTEEYDPQDTQVPDGAAPANEQTDPVFTNRKRSQCNVDT